MSVRPLGDRAFVRRARRSAGERIADEVMGFIGGRRQVDFDPVDGVYQPQSDEAPSSDPAPMHLALEAGRSPAPRPTDRLYAPTGRLRRLGPRQVGVWIDIRA